LAIHRKILRWLENELTEGNLQLGQDLPDDQRIARAIGLGRSRTREGLKTLEDMDLVRLYSGKGKEIIAHLNEEPAMAAAEPLRPPTGGHRRLPRPERTLEPSPADLRSAVVDNFTRSTWRRETCIHEASDPSHEQTRKPPDTPSRTFV